MSGKTRPTAFTLLETLVVMSIIIFLIGIMGGIFFNKLRESKIKTARHLLERISLGLTRYESETRGYPPGTEKDGGSLFRYLGKNILDARSGKTLGPYSPFRPSELVSYDDPKWGQSERLVDPWGNPVKYTADPGVQQHNLSGVEISSSGPNGIFGDKDDLNNWTY